MPQFLKYKTFRAFAIVVVLLALYAFAGFIIAPRLVRSALMKEIPKNVSGALPAVGNIHINPFLFQLTVDNFSLSDAHGEKLLGFQRLFVDFDLSSIWHRAYSFGNIHLDSPYVSALIAKDGTLNLLQLRPKPGPVKPAEKNPDNDDDIPALRIGSFKVNAGLLTYEDRSRPDVFAARLEPINFELRDFSTGAGGGKFTLTGASKLGEHVAWRGHLSVDPIESDGEIHVDGLLAHTLWSYLEDQLSFVVNSGKIDIAATYKFSLQDATADSAAHANLQVDVSKVALNDFTVRPKDADTDWISVPSLLIADTHVDLAKREARVERLSLSGVKLDAWLEPDGSVNLMKLAAAPGSGEGTSGTPAVASSAPTITATNNAPMVEAPPWHFDLRQFELIDASIAAEDRTAHPAVKVQLAPFSLRVSGASQDLTKPVNVALDTRIDDKTVLKVDGLVTPQPAVADLNVNLSDFDLTTVQPYIVQHGSMTLLSGLLGGNLKVHYDAHNPAPSMRVTGSANIVGLHTVDNTLHDDFINWERLDIQGLSYQQNPTRLDIDEVIANKLYARVIIEQDESTNVKRVLAVQPGASLPTAPTASLPVKVGTAPAGTAPIAAAAAAAASATGVVKATATAAAAVTSTAKAAAGAPAATAAAVTSSSLPMSIKKIVVQAGSANFADFSITPNFAAGIQKLEGTVTGLSSKADSRAQVDLHGAVDTFSPVAISGAVNILGPKLFTDVTLKFNNISLPLFNPYSGKFAGYNITEGKLATEFHYKVDGRVLDATHHIVVDRLEFGERTTSKDAVSLPIKLAVALLKDRNGVIDLNIPVSGTLDDPQFRLGAVIWDVFKHVLEKAVASPFELLGALFDSGPDIQFIDFQPGISQLDATAADKIKTVAKALIERPQLKIEVPIAVVPDTDGPALVAAQFNAQVSDLQASRPTKKSGETVLYDRLDAATQLDVLTRLYVKDLGSDPTYPDEVTAVKAKGDLTAAKLKFLDAAIRKNIVIGEAEFQTLGQQRAVEVQTVLLADTQVAPERVFLVANEKASVKDGFVRLELSIR